MAMERKVEDPQSSDQDSLFDEPQRILDDPYSSDQDSLFDEPDSQNAASPRNISGSSGQSESDSDYRHSLLENRYVQNKQSQDCPGRAETCKFQPIKI